MLRNTYAGSVHFNYFKMFRRKLWIQNANYNEICEGNWRFSKFECGVRTRCSSRFCPTSPISGKISYSQRLWSCRTTCAYFLDLFHNGDFLPPSNLILLTSGTKTVARREIWRVRWIWSGNHIDVKFPVLGAPLLQKLFSWLFPVDDEALQSLSNSHGGQVL